MPRSRKKNRSSVKSASANTASAKIIKRIPSEIFVEFDPEYGDFFVHPSRKKLEEAVKRHGEDQKMVVGRYLLKEESHIQVEVIPHETIVAVWES